MEISTLTLFLLGCIFVMILVRLGYNCDEEKKANEVVNELIDKKDQVSGVDSETVEKALREGKVYMLGYSSKEKFMYPGVPLYYPPALRVNDYPYGGYPVNLYSDLYDWKPYTYYGGLWFNRSYVPLLFKKQKMWRNGSWRTWNDNYYYIIY